MDNTKRISSGVIAVIVLSVLLVISLITGLTMAWFGSIDLDKRDYVMGDSVIVTIGEDYQEGDGVLSMQLPEDAKSGGLSPGMTITPNIKVKIKQSNTNALLRARFLTNVEYEDGYVDAMFADTTKFPNRYDVTSEGANSYEGRIILELEDGSMGMGEAGEIYKYNVFAGYIYYDYYNYVGQRLKSDMTTIVTQEEQDLSESADALQADIDAVHTKKVHLNRVEVRDSIVSRIGSDQGWTINGITTIVTEKNAAELEIRQRSLDISDAINRVINGQQGYVINNETSELMLGDIKFNRRVADGWAYREADSAWYYLGSATNGFVLDKDGKSTGKSASCDITSYEDVDTGENTIKKAVYSQILLNDDTVDSRRNYLGGTSDDLNIDRVVNEIAVLNEKSISSIDLSQGDVSIDFLTKKFVLPTFINNKNARAKVTFTFRVEAIQDYLVDPLQIPMGSSDRIPNNLVNAILVFNNAFPQLMFPYTDDDSFKLSAIGSYNNVIPGGGTSVAWNNSNENMEGYTTVLFNSHIVQNAQDKYAYGFLNKATMEGETYYYKDPTGKTEEQLNISSTITGFGVKANKLGKYVADYSVVAPYTILDPVMVSEGENAGLGITTTGRRGTASSLGVCPTIESTYNTLVGNKYTYKDSIVDINTTLPTDNPSLEV